MPKAVKTWNSARLGFAAILSDVLVFVLLYFGLAVAASFGGACFVPVISLTLIGIASAQLFRSVDQKRTVPSRVWAVLTASMLAACLLSIVNLRAPPPPALGEDVSSVVERFGTPESDSRSENGEIASEEYTLCFRIESPGLYSYVVHVADGRVTKTEVRSCFR